MKQTINFNNFNLSGIKTKHLQIQYCKRKMKFLTKKVKYHRLYNTGMRILFNSKQIQNIEKFYETFKRK